MRCPTRRSYRPKSANKFSKKFCAKVTTRCCWTISNCCANSVATRRGRQISVGHRSSAGAAVSPARHSRAVSRTDSRRGRPSRLEATRTRTCSVAVIGRSVSMRKFSRSAFFALAGRNGCDLSCRPLSAGDHPYARVQLLTVARAQNQDGRT